MITAVDTETYLVSSEEPIPKMVSIAFCDQTGAALMASMDAWRERFFCALAGRVAFANAPFDIGVILRAEPQFEEPIIKAYSEGRILDVLTREKLIDISEGEHFRRGRYNLGAVASRRAGMELDKEDPWRLKYAEFDGIPIRMWPLDAQLYAIKDAEATYRVAMAQQSYPLEDQERQSRAALALYAQTVRGVDTDQQMVERLDDALKKQWTGHAVSLLTSGLAKVTGRKNPKLSRRMKDTMERVTKYAEENNRPVTMTSRGPSLTEDALKALKLPEGHVLHSYQQFGSIQALREKNIAPFKSSTVRTRYDECIATGRTSSSAPGPWPGTNLQNLPRSVAKPLGFQSERELKIAHEGPIGFRECLVPPEGYSFVISDWGMMELICLAQTQYDWFSQSTMGDALRDGRDPHEELGSTIAGFDIRGHAERKKWRTLAKAPNFGYPGGLGAKRFCDFARGSYGIELTEYRARELKALWRRQWPEMELYHNRINAMSRDGNGKITMRLDRTGFTRGGCSFTEACNFPFQALAAACAKDALWAIWRACRPGQILEGSWQSLFVHDENVICAPCEKSEEAKVALEGIMRTAVSRLCPDVPIGVESIITQRYTK